MKILVTDGTYINSLAVIRVLGKNNYIGITSQRSKILNLCRYSRFTNNFHKLSSYHKSVDDYARELLEITDKGKYDAIIPVGLSSYLAVSKYKAEFLRKTRTAIADWNLMQIAYTRDQALNFARSLGIPVPASCRIINEDSAGLISKYPVVLKHSSYKLNLVKYCNDQDELRHHISLLDNYDGTVVQEYIKGFGCGFYGIYDNGKLVAHFMHRRIQEFPTTGGASAVAESYYDDKLFEYGHRLCDALCWHGPIMAEFKYDTAHNDYRLIEINPKLWGSLDLTINAGINVPELLIDIACQRRYSSPKEYKPVRYHWIFPGQFKVLMSNFTQDNLKYFFTSLLKRKTNMNFRDPLPTLFEIFEGLVKGIILLMNRNARYPYGVLRKPE